MFCDVSIKHNFLWKKCHTLIKWYLNLKKKPLKNLVHLINSLWTNFSFWYENNWIYFNCTVHVLPNPYLGYEFENINLQLSCKEKNIRNRCTIFLLLLIKQLQQRLPSKIYILRNILILNINECLNEIKPTITYIYMAEIFIKNEEALKKNI